MNRPEPDELGFLNEIPDFVANSEVESRPRPPVLPEHSVGRATVRARRWAVVALSLGWFAVHLAVYGIRRDLSALPLPYLLAQIVLPFVLALGSLGLAMSPGKLGLGLSAGLLALVCIVGPLSFVLIAIGAPPPVITSRDGTFWLSTLVCLDITLAWAALPLLGSALSLRRAFASGARVRAGLIGAAAGLFSGAVMNLHCPSLDPAHMSLGHGVPVLAAALAGAFVVARWSRS